MVMVVVVVAVVVVVTMMTEDVVMVMTTAYCLWDLWFVTPLVHEHSFAVLSP